MKLLPNDLRRLLVTPLSRGPAVEMIAVEDLAQIGVEGPTQVLKWCSDYEALYHEEDPKRIALDVTAAYALGKGHVRCVFRR